MDKFPHTAILSTHKLSVVDPDKGVGGGAGFLLLALPAFLPSVIYLFLTKNMGKTLAPWAPLLDLSLIKFQQATYNFHQLIISQGNMRKRIDFLENSQLILPIQNLSGLWNVQKMYDFMTNQVNLH